MDPGRNSDGYNIFATVRTRVLQALHDVVPGLPGDVAARVEVTPAREAAHGDMATNAALVAARAARRKPQDIAAALVTALAQRPHGRRGRSRRPRLRQPAPASAAPGARCCRLILRAGEAYGDSATGAGVRVNVEYVSANPTGPMHIGHCRGAVVGDALANLLASTGHAVTKEFYVNDAGNQVTALAWAAYWRYLQALGTDADRGRFRRRSARRPAISRRIPDPGRPGAGGAVRRQPWPPRVRASPPPTSGCRRCATSRSA